MTKTMKEVKILALHPTFLSKSTLAHNQAILDHLVCFVLQDNPNNSCKRTPNLNLRILIKKCLLISICN